MPMHTIREITRLAAMLAGLIAPRLRLGFVSASFDLRLDYALASISCEHCHSSRNNPHCAPRHVIYYFDLGSTADSVKLKRGSGDTPTRRAWLCVLPHGSVIGAASSHVLGSLSWSFCSGQVNLWCIGCTRRVVHV